MLNNKIKQEMFNNILDRIFNDILTLYNAFRYNSVQYTEHYCLLNNAHTYYILDINNGIVIGWRGSATRDNFANKKLSYGDYYSFLYSLKQEIT